MSICRTENKANFWCVFAAVMFLTGIVTLGLGIATGNSIFIVGVVALVLGVLGVGIGRATTPTG